jgi:exodeoxyribonuclease VII large subunit
LCAVSRETLWLDLQATQSFLASQMSQDMDGREQRLDRLQAVLSRPSTWANKQQHSVSMCSSRLARAAQQILSRQAMALQPAGLRLQRATLDMPKSHEMRLSRAALLLRSLDPALVLQRGYAWLENAQGQAIASVEELQPGAQIQARLADGGADMQVISTRVNDQ